jgi:hypothetical protein
VPKLFVTLACALLGFPAHSQSATPVPDIESPVEGRAAALELSPPIAPAGEAEWVLLPVPDSNPTIGTGLRLMAARFFRTDPRSQPSVLGAAAGY